MTIVATGHLLLYTRFGEAWSYVEGFVTFNQNFLFSKLIRRTDKGIIVEVPQVTSTGYHEVVETASRNLIVKAVQNPRVEINGVSLRGG